MPPRKRAAPKREYPAKHRVDETGGTPGQRVPTPMPSLHAPDKPGETRGKVVKDKRRGPLHERAEPKAPKVAKTTGTGDRPAKATGRASTPRRGDDSPTRLLPTVRPSTAPRGGPSRAERVAEEGRYLAQQSAIRATTAKPSVTGRAAAGAASGAAVGTALAGGNPAGTAVGAGIGAVTGGVSGAAAKRAYRAATRPYPGARRALVAEFAICAVIVALSPMTDKARTEKPGDWMRRMTALMGIFFILGLVSTGGRWGARAAAGFGGIVTVGLVVSERNLFNVIAAAFKSKGTGPKPLGPGPSEEQLSGGELGEAAGTAIQRGAELGG